MLSTSIKTRFPYQYLLIAVLILAMVLAFALYQSGVLPTISAGQPTTQNLATLSTADISTHRWEAMAKFYAAQGVQIPATGGNLTTLSNADISAYRRSEWGVPAAVQSDLEIYYLSERNSPQAPAAQYGPPGR